MEGADGDLTCWTAGPESGEATISFSDQTEAMGMIAPLVGMYGHAAVWGDFNGDESPDLFMGTFADRDAEIYQARGAEGPAPDRLLISSGDGFALDESLPEMFARTSGGTTADLDADGDLDLVVSPELGRRPPLGPGLPGAPKRRGHLSSRPGAAFPSQLGGRSVAAFDYNLDGRLDLFITADEGGSVLLRNDGDLAFSDVTSEAGLPGGILGLGVAVADVTGDRRQDIFVAGSNQLFVADGEGFRAADSSVFAWPPVGDEDLVTGASVADVNRDGLLDLAVGQHFNSTVDDGVLVPGPALPQQGRGPVRGRHRGSGTGRPPHQGPSCRAERHGQRRMARPGDDRLGRRRRPARRVPAQRARRRHPDIQRAGRGWAARNIGFRDPPPTSTTTGDSTCSWWSSTRPCPRSCCAMRRPRVTGSRSR